MSGSLKKAEKISKCSECGGKLSQYELSDNVYAGLPETEYICYACQTFIADEKDEDEEYFNENEF